MSNIKAPPPKRLGKIKDGLYAKEASEFTLFQMWPNLSETGRKFCKGSVNIL